MSTESKAFVLVLLFGTIIGLAWICQPESDRPISVSLITQANAVSRPEKARICLIATFNGSGVRHGEVRMDMSRTNPMAHGAFVDFRQCVDGYTDAQGVFIPNWAPGTPGGYIVTATVGKSGHLSGKSACFLRVEE